MDNTNDLQATLEKDKQNLICAWEKFTKAILNAAEALNNYFEHANDTAIQDLLKRLMPTENRWIPCSERLPEKYGWYQVTLKDGRVSRLYYDYKGDRWIDNVRKHMFELYDIYSKRTHKRITEEKEDVYWDDWVLAWMPLPESYEG